MALFLFVIVLSQSVLEYRSSRKAVLDLMDNQAQTLILSVATAGEKGLVAYEIQQDKITKHLFTIAEMVDRLDRLGKASKPELESIQSANGVSLLTTLDQHGVTIDAVVSDTLIEPRIAPYRLSPILAENAARLELGFVNFGGPRIFAVASKRSRGGAIIVGVDASELLALRRTFGAGSVIDDMSRSPGVEYAAILKSGQILAASDNFPRELADSWYLSDSSDSTATRTRIRPASGERTIFEAMAPFLVAGEVYGEIIIGINTSYLQLLTDKLRRDIIWRSLLFLSIAVVAITGFLLRQNYRLLTSQYDIIKEDVRRLEADRALNAKLAAMGELASGVAHEIRNPLNAISVITQRLEREFEPKDGRVEYKELTAIVKNETERINNSIQQFLTLAKPPVLNKKPADLNECVRNAAALFEPRANEKGCRMQLDLNRLPVINIDSELCRQAILNLLENSLAVVDSDGKISIETRKEGKSCVLSVADNGPGIPDDQRERIFDLYYTTKPAGTGLGLPTVLRIVKEHGGRIEVLDNPGGGAVFRLEFPIA
jgi:signal transduction histidine kinase